MSLEMYCHWSQSQYKRWDGGDDICALQIPMGDRVSIFVSVHMMPSSLVGERRRALEDLDVVRKRFPADSVEVLMGDRNAHAGNDFPGDAVHTGLHALPTPTTTGGRIHRAWLHTTSLCMIDIFNPSACRATWRHNVTGKLYEIDFICASEKIRHQQSPATFTCVISDHWGKQVVMHLSTPGKHQLRVRRKERFRHFQRCKELQQAEGRPNVHALRGPSDSAGCKRAQFREYVERQGRQGELYTDGSHGAPPSQGGVSLC